VLSGLYPARGHAGGTIIVASSANDIIDAALKLPESDRLLIATRLLETLPDDQPGLSEDDPGFMDELERRASDKEPTIPVSDLWKQD
jgi:hypothetical protein